MSTIPTNTIDFAGLPPAQPGDYTWAIAQMFPLQGEWTESAYLRLDLRRGYELSNGFLSCLPMPTFVHQRIAQYLFKLLDSFASSRSVGLAFIAPFMVKLWQGEMRMPDVVLARQERLIGPNQGSIGAELAFEVVSPGPENTERDWELKHQLYAKAGIREYWVVDPQARRIAVFWLENEEYVMIRDGRPGDTVASKLFPDFSVNVDKAFEVANWPPQH